MNENMRELNMRELQFVDVDHLDMHYWRFHSHTQELEVLEDVVFDKEAKKFLFIGTLPGCLGIVVACMDSLDKQGKKSTNNGNDCSMYGKCESSSKNDMVSLKDVSIYEESKQVQQESLECMDFKEQDNMVNMDASDELVDAKICPQFDQLDKNFSRVDAYKRYGSINDDSLRDRNAIRNLNAGHGLMQISLDASMCADLEDTCFDFARSFDSLRIEEKLHDASASIREELTDFSHAGYEDKWFLEELWALGPTWDIEVDVHQPLDDVIANDVLPENDASFSGKGVESINDESSDMMSKDSVQSEMYVTKIDEHDWVFDDPQVDMDKERQVYVRRALLRLQKFGKTLHVCEVVEEEINLEGSSCQVDGGELNVEVQFDAFGKEAYDGNFSLQVHKKNSMDLSNAVQNLVYVESCDIWYPDDPPDDSSFPFDRGKDLERSRPL